jgi:hypothetical protein
MSINRIKLWLTFLLWHVLAQAGYGQGGGYTALYANEYSEAKAFYTEHRLLFEDAARYAGFTPEFLFGIVAPELTQYSYLRNKVETYSLRVFYVQSGKEYADFSIGCFQMKPSFIERLEEHLSADSLLRAKYALCLFAQPESKAARSERVSRLNSVEWQINYLALFCETVRRRFGHLEFSTEEERLRFYASAYNSGFHRSAQQINETAQKALFPHFSKQKFRYADISIMLYRETVTP